jgi:xanthosine utilization system XapX-like protein
MGFIPVGDLMRELVLALGAALLVGNLAVLVRERRRAPGDVRPRPNMKIVALNLVLGFVLAAWGLASLLAA